MTAFDISELITTYRNGANAILSPTEGILGKVQAARVNLDLLGITTPATDSLKVRKGPAMPAPDATDDNATDAEKPWSKPDQGQNQKFTGPDRLLGAVAALQHLQAAMADLITFTGANGLDVTMPAGTALALIR